MSKNDVIIKLLDCINNDLGENEIRKSIEEIDEIRSDTISHMCFNSKEYKKYEKEILETEKKLQIESNNNQAIMDLLEYIDELKEKRDIVEERLTYKAGFFDALTLIASLSEVKNICKQ